MHRIDFQLIPITPTAILGADEQPEMRAPSFRGMMRFWWRAVRAAGASNIASLQAEEGRIFGATSKGSSVQSLVLNPSVPPEMCGEDLSQEMEGKGGAFYLLYSIAVHSRKYVKADPKAAFVMRLSSRSGSTQDLKIAACSLWCTVVFGGVGTRSRRGAGNFRIGSVAEASRGIEGWAAPSASILDGLEFDTSGLESPEQAKAWIAKNYAIVKSTIGQDAAGNLCPYSNLKRAKILKGSEIPKKAKIVVLPAEGSWVKALDRLGSVFRSMRPDFEKDPNFGMPIAHKDCGNRKTRLVPYDGDKRISDRRASPLIFKILQGKEGCFPMLVSLAGPLLPPCARIGIETNKQKKGEILPDPSRVEDFVEELKQQNAGCVELDL